MAESNKPSGQSASKSTGQSTSKPIAIKVIGTDGEVKGQVPTSRTPNPPPPKKD
jgi:hypothetical protein